MNDRESSKLQEGKDFLSQICEAHGISGAEDELGDMVAWAFEPLVDEIRTDALRNVIMLRRGSADNGPSVMLAAHMDEIGLAVTKIEDEGFIRFTAVGGVDPRNLLAKEVLVLGRRTLPGIVGIKPPHLISPDERGKAIKREDMFIDVGLDADEVRKQVSVGDLIAFDRSAEDLAGDRITAKALDDRAGVAALYEAALRLQDLRHDADIYLVATVQEEVGLRGAMTSTYGIRPDMGIAVDVGLAEMPGVPEERSLKMGKGPGIGQGANIHPHLHEKLVSVAKQQRIPNQKEVIAHRSGTDAWAMQVTRSGVPTAVLSIPLRYMHTSVELVSWSDVRDTAALMAEFCGSVDREFVEGFYHENTG